MGIFYFSNLTDVEIEGIVYKNIYTRIHIKDLYRDDKNLFNVHKITEGKDVQQLAYELYDNRAYYWIILMSNNMTDWMYDLPLSDEELREKLDVYMLTAPTGTNADALYVLWQEENEKKRIIYALKPALVPDLLDKIKTIYSR